MIQEERMMVKMLAARGIASRGALYLLGREFVQATGYVYSVSQAMSWISSECHRQRREREAKHKKASSGQIKDKRGVYTQLTMF